MATHPPSPSNLITRALAEFKLDDDSKISPIARKAIAINAASFLQALLKSCLTFMEIDLGGRDDGATSAVMRWGDEENTLVQTAALVPTGPIFNLLMDLGGPFEHGGPSLKQFCVAPATYDSSRHPTGTVIKGKIWRVVISLLEGVWLCPERVNGCSQHPLPTIGGMMSINIHWNMKHGVECRGREENFLVFQG